MMHMNVKVIEHEAIMGHLPVAKVVVLISHMWSIAEIDAKILLSTVGSYVEADRVMKIARDRDTEWQQVLQEEFGHL